ncbi:arsenate reductase ArsC [Methylophaga pinxianii]|uniref:arsenate reductase ArsC n=1 Tax=Methylophaga pinxianii TaxID=2881052 RepID=UPI001CF5DAEF|nr:arsenate reductase ArsC [Methylophaga pinxianii]MCB2425805.1 arsenate reductase ArsC [Methylophaga pinxianii]UPH46257.1 arsenate reductase ArsC [Methylophaga pinxianii]
MEKFRIMFLCTGNSCRSQMAEGWARFLTHDDIEICSAGIEAHGQNVQAIKVMAEVGIDISSQESIRVNGEMLEWADLLVTLCENADEQCPVVSPHTLRLHLPLTDPAKFRGTEDEILAEFRITREKIKQRVNYVLQQLNKSVANSR